MPTQRLNRLKMVTATGKTATYTYEWWGNLSNRAANGVLVDAQAAT